MRTKNKGNDPKSKTQATGLANPLIKGTKLPLEERPNEKKLLELRELALSLSSNDSQENVAHVVQQIEQAGGIEFVISMLSHKSTKIKDAALLIFNYITGHMKFDAPKALNRIVRIAATSRNEDLSLQALGALGKFIESGTDCTIAIPVITNNLEMESLQIKYAAARVLQSAAAKGLDIYIAVPGLVRVFTLSYEDVKPQPEWLWNDTLAGAGWALSSIAAQGRDLSELMPVFISTLSDENLNVKSAAIAILQNIAASCYHVDSAIPMLVSMLWDPNPNIAGSAFDALLKAAHSSNQSTRELITKEISRVVKSNEMGIGAASNSPTYEAVIWYCAEIMTAAKQAETDEVSES